MTPRRLVVDANVLLSAFLRDGITRELLLHAPIELYAPAWLRGEVERHLFTLAARKGVPAAVARPLLDRLMQRIQEVPGEIIARHAAQAIQRCTGAGEKDAPYVACALGVDAAIWTQDKRLAAEAGVRVCTTLDLAKDLRR